MPIDATAKSRKSPIVHTMREVAEAFGVIQRTVAQWKTKGMPCVKMKNKSYEYDLDDIYKWKLSQSRTVDEVIRAVPLEPILESNITHIGEFKEKIEEFKLKKADILSSEQMSSLDLQKRIKKLKLANLDDEQLMKLTNSEAARWFQLLGVDFAIKYDKEQLERNKGVDNVNKILDIIGKIKGIDGREAGDSGV